MSYHDRIKSYMQGTDASALAIAQRLRAGNVEGLELSHISEMAAKMLFLQSLARRLADQYETIFTAPQPYIAPWVRELEELGIVMTFHPTPNMLYGAETLDDALAMAFGMNDTGKLRRGVNSALRNPLRNIVTPDDTMLANFTERFGETIRIITEQLQVNLAAKAWVGTDLDGNPNVTPDGVLQSIDGAMSTRQIRVGIDDLRQCFDAVYPDAGKDLAELLGREIENPSRKVAGVSHRVAMIFDQLQERHEVDANVIADCQTVPDVLKLAILYASIGRRVRNAPLLERFERITDWMELMAELLSVKPYRQYIEESDNEQVFQVGPSDTAAHAGFWSLLGVGHLIRQMLDVIKTAGVKPVLFVGTGRNPARGGGPDLHDLASLVPLLKGDVSKVMFTVQGGMVADCFRNETVGRYHVMKLLEALSTKAPHDNEISEALLDFATRAASNYAEHNGQVRRLLAGSPWAPVLKEARLSNRPLSKGNDPSGAGLRAIGLQQHMSLVGGEALILLGWREAWDETPADQRALLWRSNRFRKAVRFAHEATHLTDFHAMGIAAEAAEMSDWITPMRERVLAMQSDFAQLLEADGEAIAERAKATRQRLALRTHLATRVGEGNGDMPVQVILLQYILLTLGRFG